VRGIAPIDRFVSYSDIVNYITISQASFIFLPPVPASIRLDAEALRLVGVPTPGEKQLRAIHRSANNC
jgi:hypothetical protein